MGDGAAKSFDGSCTGSEPGAGNPDAASGYIGVPSPHWSGPEVVWINGCATANGDPMAGSLSLTGAQAMVGTTTTAACTYDSGTDTYQNTGTTTLTVTEALRRYHRGVVRCGRDPHERQRDGAHLRHVPRLPGERLPPAVKERPPQAWCRALRSWKYLRAIPLAAAALVTFPPCWARIRCT